MSVSDHMSEVCQTEIRGLIARAPRMVAGTTEWTPSTMGFQYRLALADDLASELTELVADVPAAPTQSERLLEFAFGVRIGAARDFLIRKATALSQERYECESLQGINERATEALVTLNYPMPPLVNNLLGFRASLSQVPEEGMNPSEMVGTVALHVDKPEMFVGMSQMFLPQLAEFQLEKGGPPVRLPESLIPVPDIVAFAAMSDDAIGVSVGQGEETRLLNFLETEAEHDGSFFSVNYDIAAYMDRLTEFQHMSGAMDDGIMDGEYEGDRDARALRNTEMAEAFQEAFKNMAGRSELAFRFDEGGFAVDSRMQFQKLEE
jgi:hypothetical protein